MCVIFCVRLRRTQKITQEDLHNPHGSHGYLILSFYNYIYTNTLTIPPSKSTDRINGDQSECIHPTASRYQRGALDT